MLLKSIGNLTKYRSYDEARIVADRIGEDDQDWKYCVQFNGRDTAMDAVYVIAVYDNNNELEFIGYL